MAIDISWILGISIMFSLAFFMAFLTSIDIETFFGFLTIFCGFVVWAGLLPLWILVVCFIVIMLLLAKKLQSRRGV